MKCIVPTCNKYIRGRGLYGHYMAHVRKGELIRSCGMYAHVGGPHYEFSLPNNAYSGLAPESPSKSKVVSGASR